MLIYEVNIEVQEEAKFGFAGWLPGHIEEVLKSPGFKGAQWFFRNHEEEGREPSSSVLWTVQYIVEDRQHLDAYLRERGPSLRQEAVDRFDGKFTITRRVLHLLNVITGVPA